jgi:Tol biopolymer transport system component
MKSLLFIELIFVTIISYSQQNRITNIQDSYPMISADGKRIVFQSNRTGFWQIFIMDADGKNQKQLTNDKFSNTNPILSSDGLKIVFASNRDGNSEIYYMNVDGSSQTRLTNFPGDDSHPHWSPDGRRIIFNSARTTQDISIDWLRQIHEIFTMNADGTDVKQITFLKSVSSNPHFSLDGKKIAFRHILKEAGFSWSLNPQPVNSEIFIADADGNNPINLSKSPAYDTWPWWSPDGKYVVFSSNREKIKNTGQLYVASVNGNSLRQITFGPGGIARPCWSADGTKIIAQQSWGTDESGGSLVSLLIDDKLKALIESPVSFRELKGSTVTADGGLSRGISTVDFDLNGWQDITIANSGMQQNLIYKNDSSILKRWFDNDIVLSPANTEGVHWVDYDNDYDLDLFVTNILTSKNYLFKNDSNKIFKKTDAGELTSDISSSPASCWCDVDKDGDLDVFVVNRDDLDDALYINDGKKNFSKLSGPWAGNKGDGRSCAWADVDNNGWPDLYIGNYLTRKTGTQAKERNFFYSNKGQLKFEEITKGDFVTDEGLTYGVSFADYDNDGDPDLLTTNAARTDHNFLYQNDGKGNFAKLNNVISAESYHPSKGHTWADFDNDGDLDLYIATGTENAKGEELYNLMYMNEGGGSFTKIKYGSWVETPDISAATAWADYDRDGDLDIAVTNWGGNSEDNAFYVNESNRNNWVTVQLRGNQSNTFGIGAKISIMYTVNGHVHTQHQWMFTNTGYASQTPYELHFGIGQATIIDSIEVQWPDGSKQQLSDLNANSCYLIKESN